MFVVSVIIPAYQAEFTIERAIRSLLNTSRRNEIEIIVVDDCSPDNTVRIVQSLAQNYSNIKLFSMPKNSGSPSSPRNLGFTKASAKFITTLDADDIANVDHLLRMVEEVQRNGYEFAKGYLLVKEGNKSSFANRLTNTPNPGLETIRSIISFQSLNSDYIIRTDFLRKTELQYDPTLKIGEDTKFITSLLSKTNRVAYLDDYFEIHTVTTNTTDHLSSTQKCNDREIDDQIEAWRSAQNNLRSISINFYELRLCAGLRHLLQSIVRYSSGISEKTFRNLCSFVKETQKYTQGKMNLITRYEELYKSILSADFELFNKVIRRRLLIAGYDLKFILPIVPYMQDEYEIKIDEWEGHNIHNRKKSSQLAEWADIIWCEWMLGNAVFYSKIKKKNQRLVIRAHRFEITREFGNQIDFDKVDAVFAVGYYFYEQFIYTFNIPRGKMRLVPNCVDENFYTYVKSDESKFNIGMVGIIPSLKGFLRGLQILQKLLVVDDRYRLFIYGKKPEAESWIMNNLNEHEYYQKCQTFIKNYKLGPHIKFCGFLPREEIYNNLGYVLSLSDIESFHLAPMEATSTGSIPLFLNWPGAEYIYPDKFIFGSIEEITDKILYLNSDPQQYIKLSRRIRSFVIENYGISRFLREVKSYLRQICL